MESSTASPVPSTRAFGSGLRRVFAGVFAAAVGSALSVDAHGAEPRQPATEPVSPPLVRKLGPGYLPPIAYPAGAHRFGVVDAVLTGAFATTALVFAIRGPNEGAFGPPSAFDEAARDALRPDAFEAQLFFRDTSDVLLGMGLASAFFGDALVNATWLRRSPDVGKQIALIDLEVLAVTLGLQQLVANTLGRERPFGRTCGTELDERSAPCVTHDRYLSHFSGHASVSFALASASCSHHARLGLVDSPLLPCVLSYSAAGLTSLFRVLGDQHYATDVLAGAAIGTAIGLGIPFAHYELLGSPAETSDGTSLVVVPTGSGFGVVGRFQ